MSSSPPPDGRISTLDPAPRGVVFDYGNTLIPFGRREVDLINTALAGFLSARVAGAGPERCAQVLEVVLVELFRERDRTLVESDARDVPRLCLQGLGVSEGLDDAIEEGLAVLVASFVDSVVIAEGTLEVLDSLRDRGFRIGLLSNYSRGDAIRLSLDKLGLTERFDALVVSADHGIVKPHPDLFHHVARGLSLPPQDVLFVGDNLKADVAGAAAAGMLTAWVTEHLAGAHHFEDPEENHAEVSPDLTLERLTDLVRCGDDG